MSIDSTATPTPQGSEAQAITRRIVQVVFAQVVVAAVLFVSAGTLAWGWAWVYVITAIVLVAINALVLPRDVIAERGRRKENVKQWDKVMSVLLSVTSLLIFLVAGLEYRLVGPATYAVWIHLAALALLVAGQLFFTWAMTANHFFSTRVRLQSERGHTVATGGPYRYVRHPGYLGMTVANMSVPVLLGSLWALLPATLMVVVIVVRTAFEDRMLQAELAGYSDFAQKTHYRLIPYVW